MSYVKKILPFLLLVLLGCLLTTSLALASTPAHTQTVGPRAAHRAVVRAEAVLREARHVESATRYYSTCDYSAFAYRHVDPAPVGRWVWLARHEGWGWPQIDMLMHLIARESSGSSGAKNPSSTATGLLQMLAFHWDGSGDYGWRFNPRDPTQVLSHGWLLYLKLGWSPWAL